MSIELLRYERYGNPSQAKFVIGQVLLCNKSKAYSIIKDRCLGESTRFGETLPGILEILELISIIEKDESNNITLNCKKFDLKKHINHDFNFCNELLKKFLEELYKHKLLNIIFPSDGIEYDKSITRFTIKESHIPIIYSGIKKMLIDYGMLVYDETTKTKLIVNIEFRELFEEKVIKKINHQMDNENVRHQGKIPKLSLKKIKIIVGILIPVAALIFSVYKFNNTKTENLSPSYSNDIKNSNNGVEINGNNNTVNLLVSDTNKHENNTNTENEIIANKSKVLKMFTVGQVFKDDLTKATIGVSYISSFNEANVVVNLPGQKQKVETSVSPGSSWPFYFKKKRYNLLLNEVNYIENKFSAEVIELD